MKTVLIIAIIVCVAARDDGLARTPPMGWRSWNFFHGNVDQKVLSSQVDAVTKRINGTSLLDLGYARVGLDDNWQSCGTGINRSFHDAEGRPLINLSRFPDMKGFNEYAHSKGVLTGWYMNNCICSEHGKLSPNWMPQMRGDTSAIAALGWDGVKIDGCGPSHDLEKWSNLLNATGRKVFIENCHDNTTFPYLDKVTDVLQCPLHIWRISTDINAHWGSIISNLQRMVYERVPGTQEIQLSRPGCWAYPDMLEVGVGKLTHTESRSHFGLWCVTSAPLILGFDLNDTTMLTSVWDIIANEEAIQVNQDWNGLAGKLISQCAHAQGCTYPSDMPTQWQIWGKPLTATGVSKWAVVAVNLGDHPVDFEIDFDTIGGLGSTVKAHDVWAKKDLGRHIMNYPIKALGAHDSVFLTLTGTTQSTSLVV